MILSVHATFGAAVASLVPTHPITGFFLGFASHFALDLIPHRDYNLKSITLDDNGKAKPIDLIINKINLIRDVVVATFDLLVGICLAFVLFFNPTHPLVFLIGAIGAVLPDIIAFSYLLLKTKALNSFYNFHSLFETHINEKLKKTLTPMKGVFLQFCTVSFLLVLIYGLRLLIL